MNDCRTYGFSMTDFLGGGRGETVVLDTISKATVIPLDCMISPPKAL